MSIKPIDVAVLCGVISNEREISLLSCINVALSLDKEKFKVSIIEISSQGKWFFTKYDPAKNKLIRFETIGFDIKNWRSDLRKFDVIFIALHGKLGEDGSIQSSIQSLGIPYTGSNAKASALAFDKYQTNSFLTRKDILVPRSLCVNINQQKKTNFLESIQNKIGLPCVIKPNQSGSSIGVTIVRKECDLLGAIKKAEREDKDVVVEEFIEGRELTCAVLGNHSARCIALPPI